MAEHTSVTIGRETLSELQQAKREVSAAERRTFTNDDLIRFLISAWRQITTGRTAGA